MLIQMTKLSAIIILSLIAGYLKAEIFSAIDELEKLAYDEEIIIKELKVVAGEVKNDYLNR